MPMNPRLLRPMARLQSPPTPPPTRTLYFTDAAYDGDWSNLANWFDDAEGTVAASSLPTSADSVITTTGIYANSGSEPTVVNFTFNDPNNYGPALDISITVTGIATFNGSSLTTATLTGNAVFNDIAYLAGIVTGTATFNDSACNAGGTAGTFVPNPPPSCDF